MSNRSSPRRRRRTRRFHHGITPAAIAETPPVRDPSQPAHRFHLIGYGPDEVVTVSQATAGDIRAALGRWSVLWVNAEGHDNLAAVADLAEVFRLHPLAVEDVVHIHQRAKYEQYGDMAFIVARMMAGFGRDDVDPFSSEQVSMFLGRGFLVTFHEPGAGAFLEPIRDRIRRGRGQIRTMGSDFLAYAILDTVIDSYYPVLETLGTNLEDIEDRILARPDRPALMQAHQVKRDLMQLRRVLWPHREAIAQIQRDAGNFFSSETRIYLRDCYDHCYQLLDLIETYREMSASLLDVYLSSVSNRMNEVMRVLTVISTIFIPLTFIAGVYGMNFQTDKSPWNMPELTWEWGYPLCLLLMATIAGSMLFWFKQRGWLSMKDMSGEFDAEAMTALVPVEVVTGGAQAPPNERGSRSGSTGGAAGVVDAAASSPPLSPGSTDNPGVPVAPQHPGGARASVPPLIGDWRLSAIPESLPATGDPGRPDTHRDSGPAADGNRSAGQADNHPETPE